MNPNRLGATADTPASNVRMSLRSSCKGDCEQVKSGTVGRGQHHHHHHHHEKVTPITKTRQSVVQLTNSARSAVASKQTSIRTTSTASHAITSDSLRRSLDSGKQVHLTVTPATPITSRSSLGEASKSVKVFSHSSQTEVVTEGNQNFSTVLDHSLGTPSMPWLHLSSSERNAPAFDWSEKTSAGSTSTSNTIQSVHRRRKQYSDYSSGEEYDLDTPPKTDYTYAYSSSYSSRESAPRVVPSPNMSRRELRSLATTSTPYSDFIDQKRGSSKAKASASLIGSSAILVSTAQGAAADRNSVLEGASGFSDQRYNTSSARLSYGLDYESDADEDFNQAQVNHYRQYEVRSVTTSKITNIFRYAASPFKSVWRTSWSYLYRLMSAFLVLDTWILSQQLLKKWWILLPLLLLPLLLIGSSFIQDDATNAVSAVLSSIGVPVLPFFAIFGNKTSSNSQTVSSMPSVPPVIVPSATSSCPDNQLAISNLNEMILNIHQTQKAQLNRAQVEDIVRSVVKQEMLKFTPAATSNQADVNIQAKSLSEHSAQLADLQAQMQLILSQSQTLADELKNTKEKILEERRSNHKDSLQRLEGLEIDLDSLKDNIRHVQETQVMLLANMRNCCRNHTYDPAVVENQVAAILMQVMGKSPPSGRGRSEFMSFTDWLKSSFVAQSDLESKLSSKAAQMSHVLSQDVSAKAEAAAKLAAAAAVQASLSERKFSANVAQNVSVALSEDDIRKIVRDALTIYDADKTGQPDFALESAGGSIISTRCSETYQSRTGQISLLGIPLWFTSNTPRVAIQPGVQPGECWAFKGSEGYLVIQLSGWVQPTAFSIEHISRTLVPDHGLDSAPKDFSVYGLKSDKDMDSVLIGRYTYSVDGEPLQYFAVADPDIEAFPIVELRIHSNHGNLEYTCLYRFRVHGNVLKRS